MIGKRPSLGTGFKGLQQYLLHGRNGAAPDRSVWTATRNLPDPDPEKAAAVMRHTANTSTRVEKPVYHLSVSLAPGEHLERRELERVADRLLRDLGLEQHQALVAEHADGAHQHIHLMVNRVHPDTGRAWNTSHDYRGIERSLRAQERELGLRIVPGRHALVPGIDRFMGTRLGTGEFPEQVRGLVGGSLRESSNWQEAHASLARHGLALEPSRSGRGLVVTDGQRYVAASKVERGASRPRLEARLGPFEPASPDLQKLKEVSRTLQARGRLEAMRGQFLGARRELEQNLADHRRHAEGVARASERLDKALGEVYRDPGAARRHIEESLERRGSHETAKALRQRPTAAGKLRGHFGSRTRGLAREVANRQVPTAIREYATARLGQQMTVRRLERFRRNPQQPVLQAARRASRLLQRGLDRLEKLDRQYAPQERLRAQATALVKRLGWQVVSRLIPPHATHALRLTVSVAKAPVRMLDRGLGR